MLTPREATESNVKLSITVIVYMYIFTEIHENSVLTLGIILVTEMLYIDEEHVKHTYKHKAGQLTLAP